MSGLLPPQPQMHRSAAAVVGMHLEQPLWLQGCSPAVENAKLSTVSPHPLCICSAESPGRQRPAQMAALPVACCSCWPGSGSAWDPAGGLQETSDSTPSRLSVCAAPRRWCGHLTLLRAAILLADHDLPPMPAHSLACFPSHHRQASAAALAVAKDEAVLSAALTLLVSQPAVRMEGRAWLKQVCGPAAAVKRHL